MASSPPWSSARRCGRQRRRPARPAPRSPRPATSDAAGATARWSISLKARCSASRAPGLTVEDWQNLIFVDQNGKRFWNEVDGSYNFFAACMAWHGDKTKLNGGGPVWAIFDADGAAREKWNTKPPNVDPDGFFFSADTIAELAGKIKNPYQKQAMPGAVLQETVGR